MISLLHITHGLIPVIYPNRRNAKTPIVIARKFRGFRKDIYKDRITFNDS